MDLQLLPLGVCLLTTPVLAQAIAPVPSELTPLWSVQSQLPAAALGALADPGEQRALFVELNELDWATANDDEEVLELELFDRETLTLVARRMGSPRPGAAIWHASWADGGSFSLAVQNESMHATLRLDGSLYKLRPRPTGGHMLAEVDASELPPCGNKHEHEVASVSQAESGALAAEALLGPLTMIDVLVAWTPAAKNQAGGTNGITSLIDLAVFETNQSFQNGNAQCAMRLVHAYETNYSESGSMSQDLSRFRSTSDSHMPEVHGLRNTYGADACALISTGGGACGVGYLMTNVTNSFKSSAFNTTARGCAVGNLTFGHEFGHNFGCAHDKGNAGSASKFYAYGYRTPNNQYRTVMAYSPGQRVPVFSSPLAEWNGWTMGVANSEDNGRALDLNNATIAGWRPTQVAIVDCNNNGVHDPIDIAFGLEDDSDGDGVLDSCTSLFAEPTIVPIIPGGTQTLELNAGSEHANRLYLLLGTASGTSPGTTFGNVDVPLNLDPYTNWVLSGSSFVSSVAGFLDSNGEASNSIVIPPGLVPLSAITLTEIYHAFVVYDEFTVPVFASTPAHLVLGVL